MGVRSITRIEYEIFNEIIYRRRKICERFFRTLTNSFGDKITYFKGNFYNKILC